MIQVIIVIVIFTVIGLMVRIQSQSRNQNQGKSQKENSQGGRQNRQTVRTMPQNTGYGRQTVRTVPQNANYSRQTRDTVQKQRALKERLEKLYKTNVTGPSNEIIDRANANVRENSKDRLRGELRDGRDLMAAEAESALMKEVSDLIITGYWVKPVGDRDFVAEGVEMLNRYEAYDGQKGQESQEHN